MNVQLLSYCTRGFYEEKWEFFRLPEEASHAGDVYWRVSQLHPSALEKQFEGCDDLHPNA